MKLSPRKPRSKPRKMARSAVLMPQAMQDAKNRRMSAAVAKMKVTPPLIGLCRAAGLPVPIAEHRFRTSWGVQLFGSQEDPTFLFAAWAGTFEPRYIGEPPHPLLFKSRAQARRWCRQQHEKFSRNNICSKWRFRPVRVIERWEIQ